MKKLFFVFLLIISVLIVSCAKEETKVVKTEQKQETAIAPEQAKAELTDTLAGRIKNYRITYRFSSNESQQINELTLAFKDDKRRIDVSESGKFTSSVFILGDKAYICTEQPQKMCIMTDFNEANQSSFTGEEELSKDIINLDVRALPSRTITGINAKCYAIVSETSSDICYSREGIMLYLKTSTNEMTATSYTTNVPDSLFVLPATPQNLNAYYGN